jgi:hypothetical protein
MDALSVLRSLSPQPEIRESSSSSSCSIYWALHRERADSAIASSASFRSSFAVFCGLVSELANVWDGQVELAGSVVGGGSEVDEVLESPSHSLC